MLVVSVVSEAINLCARRILLQALAFCPVSSAWYLQPKPFGAESRCSQLSCNSTRSLSVSGGAGNSSTVVTEGEKILKLL